MKRNRNGEGWEWGRYWIWLHVASIWVGFHKQEKIPTTFWPDNPKKPGIKCHYYIFYIGFFILEFRT